MSDILNTSVDDARSSIQCRISNSTTQAQLGATRTALANLLNQCPMHRKTLYKIIAAAIRKCDRLMKAKECRRPG